MRHSNNVIYAISILLALFAGKGLASTPGQDIAEKGNSKGAIACKSCHGDKGQGNAAAAYPYLAGQPAAYLEKQLNDFAGKQRQSAVMAPIAMNLSKKEIRAVAEYYSTLEFSVKPVEIANVKLADKGRGLASQGKWSLGVPACFQCHGSEGQGIAPHFPAISGQPVQYLKKQLELWRTDQRSNDPDGLMKAVVSRLDAKDIEAVSEYLSSKSPVSSKK